MLIKVIKRILHKVPHVGDPVWWAPMGVGCRVIKTQLNGRTIFQGGPLIRRPSGREVPQYTVSTAPQNFKWHPQLGVWVVGQGNVPATKDQIVIQMPLLKVKPGVFGL